MKKKLAVLSILLSGVFPLALSAHEVYVLTPGEIGGALTSQSPNPFDAVLSQPKLFAISGVGIALVLFLVFALSVNPVLERIFGSALIGLKRFAPLIGRLTLGLALLASGYYKASFGPELPVSATMSLVLLILGVLVLVGCITRLAALVGIVVYLLAVVKYEWYMLTYLNYLGEMILVFVLGGGMWSLDRHISVLGRVENAFGSLKNAFEKYSFLILRICFGASLFFASFYAKFIHSNLALDTVNDYHLTNHFPFTPLFLVLGAFLVEALIGACFFFGIGIRFIATVFTGFLTLSILFFGESVWPHIILFGVGLTLFAHGYDKYTVGMIIQGKRLGEPVL